MKHLFAHPLRLGTTALLILAASGALLGCPNGEITVGPSASFEASPRTGTNTLNVQFIDTSNPGTSGAIVSYAWEFGDGGTSTLANPSHTYAKPGLYTVKLTIVTQSSSADVTMRDYVAVTTSGFALALGTPGHEAAHAMTKTHGFGFMLAGSHLGAGQQYYAGVMANADALGAPTWYSYHTETSDLGFPDANLWLNDVLQLDTQDYVSVGTRGESDLESLTMRLDRSGVEQASALTNGSPGADELFGMCLASNGHTVAAGETYDRDSGRINVLVGSFDLSGGGAIDWARSVATTEAHHARAIVPAVGGGYYVAGILVHANGDEDGFIMKLDNGGALVSSTQYGYTSSKDGFQDLISLQGGGYAAVGYTESLGNRQMWVVLLRSDGSYDTQADFGSGELDEEALGVDQTQDGGLVLAGYSVGDGGRPELGYGYLVKTTADWTQQWERRVDTVANNGFHDVVQVPDGCYAACGWIDSKPGSYGNGGQDMYLLKVDPLGAGSAVPATRAIAP